MIKRLFASTAIAAFLSLPAYASPMSTGMDRPAFEKESHFAFCKKSEDAIFLAPGAIGLLSAGRTGFIKSIQHVTATIAANALTGTATISSVTTANCVVFVNGGYGGGSSTIQQNVADAVMTNTTTATVTRGAVDASQNLIVSLCVVELDPSVIQSIQTSSISLNNATSNTATISSVTTNNAISIMNGWSTVSTATSWGIVPAAALTNATTVTATCGQTTAATNTTVRHTTLELKAGVLNSAVQNGTVVIASGTATSNTATISSVSTSTSLLIFDGWNYPNAIATTVYTIFPTLAFTNATTITMSTQYTPSRPSAITGYFVVAELKASYVKSSQSGTTTIGNGSTSNTSTISSVNRAKTINNFLGFNTSLSTAFLTANTDSELSNSTTQTSNRNTSTTATATAGWQQFELN